MKKRYLALGMAAVMTVTMFSGCGKKEAAEEKQETTKAETGEAAETEKTAAKEDETAAENKSEGGEKTEISIWMTPAEEASMNYWKETFKAYNETNQDNINVTLEFVPEDAQDSKLKAAQANGTAPELCIVNHADALVKGEQGLYLPLNDYIDQEVADDLYPNVKEMVTTKEGNYYSIPMFLEPYSLLFYRKDLFTEAGLDPENPPKTFDELLEDAKALTTDTTFGLAIAGSADVGWVNWADMASMGLNYINDDWSEATVNNDISRRWLEARKKLYDEKVVPEQALSGYWDIQPLAEKRVAMQLNGSWAISRLLVDFKDTVNSEDIGIALAPTLDGLKDGDMVGALGGWGFAIDGKAKHPEEVAKVIRYLLYDDPERTADFFTANCYAKFTASQKVNEVLSKREDENKIDEWYDLISEKVIPYSQAEPVFPWEINQFFVNCIDNVIVNGTDIDTALEQCSDEINNYIEINELAGTNPK